MELLQVWVGGVGVGGTVPEEAPHEAQVEQGLPCCRVAAAGGDQVPAGDAASRQGHGAVVWVWGWGDALAAAVTGWSRC